MIEFVSQFLLRKIAGAASKVAGKIKAIAAEDRQAPDGGHEEGRQGGQEGLQQAQGEGQEGQGEDLRPEQEEGPEGPEDKDKDKDAAYEQRLDAAVTAIRPQAESMLHSGTSKTKLTAKLAYWRLRYRIKSLQMTGASGQIVARAPAERTVVQSAISKSGGELHDIIRRVARDVLADVPDEQIDEIIERRKAGEGSSEENPRILGSPGAEALALGGGKKVLVDGEPMGINDVGIRRRRARPSGCRPARDSRSRSARATARPRPTSRPAPSAPTPRSSAALAKIKQQSAASPTPTSRAPSPRPAWARPRSCSAASQHPHDPRRDRPPAHRRRDRPQAVRRRQRLHAHGSVGKDRTVEEAIMKGPPAPLKGTTAGKASPRADGLPATARQVDARPRRAPSGPRSWRARKRSPWRG